MEIRQAQESEVDRLSALAMRSKAHWGYAAPVLEGWREALKITAADTREARMFVAVEGGELLGFYSLRPSPSAWELDNLWVVPEYMRRGIGRALLAHAMEVAIREGAEEILVDADPNAERFYLEQGADRRGEVPAPIPGQPDRVRPQLAFGLHAMACHAADRSRG